MIQGNSFKNDMIEPNMKYLTLLWYHNSKYYVFNVSATPNISVTAQSLTPTTQSSVIESTTDSTPQCANNVIYDYSCNTLNKCTDLIGQQVCQRFCRICRKCVLFIQKVV